MINMMNGRRKILAIIMISFINKDICKTIYGRESIKKGYGE